MVNLAVELSVQAPHQTTRKNSLFSSTHTQKLRIRNMYEFLYKHIKHTVHMYNIYIDREERGFANKKLNNN